VILGGGVAVCLLLLSHREVIFAIALLSCYSVASHVLAQCVLIILFLSVRLSLFTVQELIRTFHMFFFSFYNTIIVLMLHCF